jgi:mycofactocin system glycosyltransferase
MTRLSCDTVAPLPIGFSITLDPEVRRIDEDALFGGTPARVMRLSRAGRSAFAELVAGPIRTPAAAALARRLTDAGLAHPQPPHLDAAPDITVLIPVRDRPAELDRCLRALGDVFPVVVVDDASGDTDAIAKVAADHGAVLVRRDVNGGPGAARNTGLAHVATEFVAMIDSDCVPQPGWIEHLAAHLVDPLVAVAAPRIAAANAGPGLDTAATDRRASYAARYAAARGILDLGAEQARVQPLGRVAFVPSAALVARVAALREIAEDGGVFDPSLRTGEDVDLIWRLHKAGWRIRYDAQATVTHHEPESWRVLLRRRFRYGTSAGPLAKRHPEAMPPLVVNTWPTAAVAGAVIGSPAVIAAGCAGSYVQTRRALGKARVPLDAAPRMARASVLQSWLATGRFASQLASPLLIAGLLRRRSRAAALALLVGPALVNWWRSDRALDPVRFTVAHLVDDAVYGAGVWASAITERTPVPLTPVSTKHVRRALQNG